MSAPAATHSAMEVSAHDRSVEELQKIFGVDESGLSDHQVEDNRKKYGPNGKLLVILSLGMILRMWIFSHYLYNLGLFCQSL